MLPTISITTPCLNAVATLDQTILSVITQVGDFYIRYHVQDGGSDDGTAERLEWWQKELAANRIPLSCAGLKFSYSSEPDAGMYDALYKGISALDASKNDFLTWINADDMLSQGALAFIASVANQFQPNEVSWVGGAATVMRNNTPLVQFDSPIPTRALRDGLCDGQHWNFLQQEGTFFRKWLWDAAKPQKTICPMKLAGDWNLWRLFAQNATLVQTKFSLGIFRIQENQLSSRFRDKYMAEIETIVPVEDRRQALQKLTDNGPVFRRHLKLRYEDGLMTVMEDDQAALFSHNNIKVFGEAPKTKPKAPSKTIFTGIPAPAQKIQPAADKNPISFKDNILAFDKEWQFPAITEQHAFHQLRDLGAVPQGVTYIAYPWATLIDKLQTKAPDAPAYLQKFHDFIKRIPADTIKITVCQHIKMKEYMDLFEESGISRIFWSHCTHEDLKSAGGPDVCPFPLYPVQVTKMTEEYTQSERPFLFSFIGAKSNKYYLTEARAWILELLSDCPEGLIIGRDSWHYNKVVYDHQVFRKSKKSDELINQSASEQFKASLAQSVFSLCPSGSGPNSIRLWESLGAGAIPVILADTYAPPGNPELWEQAAVFCRETPEDIRNLPARLQEIASDPEALARMRHAGRQLWALYGPHSFIYDLQKFMLETAGRPQKEPQKADRPTFLTTLQDDLARKQQLSRSDAAFLLTNLTTNLLLGGPEALLAHEQNPRAADMEQTARGLLSADAPELHQLDRVQELLRRRAARKSISAPALSASRGLRVCLFGRHSNRTPLAYAPFQKLVQGKVDFVQAPDTADVVLTGFNLDLRENAKILQQATRLNPQLRLAVISEEPLWDSIWSDGFAERKRLLQHDGAELGYSFFNHSNSEIFDFQNIPYFLLTHEDFQARYGLLLARHTDLTPQALCHHWQNAAVPAAFYAEVRDSDPYRKSWPEQGVHGLSVYRTEVAQQVGLPGTIRVGKGWRSDAPRQALPDWHLDKIAALDMQARIVSAYENTHQNAYISEKIFDAFVVGGIPTYYAGSQHRVLELVPNSCMINTYGQDTAAAAARIADFTPDTAFAETWLETARTLQKRFTNLEAIAFERQRVADAVVTALEACMQAPPAAAPDIQEASAA
ncbi:exostosin family protein [Leisingera sp. XS_AS12]|uniref:exostosin domain-containing protein n=1 Tax=Leisingera sp. XS_AS12 TaxID=3241294 RepID=UPI0035161BDE